MNSYKSNILKLVDLGEKYHLKPYFDWNYFTIILYDLNKIIYDNKIKYISLEDFWGIYPDGIMMLLLYGELYKEKMNDTLIITNLPNKNTQKKFLKSIDFYKISTFDYFIDIDILNKIKEEKIFNPITKVSFNNLNKVLIEIDNLSLSILSKIVTGHQTIQEISYLSYPFKFSLDEIIKNIVFHSCKKEPDCGEGYFLIYYLKKQNIIRIFIGDIGQGFLNSLNNKNIKCEDDAEAIIKALLYKYHSKEEEAHGLFHVIKYLNVWNGYIRIGSGEKQVKFNLKNKELNNDFEVKNLIENEFKSEKRTFFPGVQFMFDLYIEE